MKVRMRTTSASAAGVFTAGQTVDVPPKLGMELCKAKAAEHIKGAAREKAVDPAAETRETGARD